MKRLAIAVVFGIALSGCAGDIVYEIPSDAAGCVVLIDDSEFIGRIIADECYVCSRQGDFIDCPEVSK